MYKLQAKKGSYLLGHYEIYVRASDGYVLAEGMVAFSNGFAISLDGIEAILPVPLPDGNFKEIASGVFLPEIK